MGGQADQLDDDAKKAFKEAFDGFDKNGDGTLDVSELRVARMPTWPARGARAPRSRAPPEPPALQRGARLRLV